MKRKLAVLGAMALCLSSVTLTSTAFASDTVLTTQALAEPIPVPTEELVDAEPGCYMKIVSELDKTVYRIGDKLDLTGLKIDVMYAPGGAIPVSQVNNAWRTVIDAENPLENENFIVDTSEFDSSKAGEYNIKVSLTDDAMSYKWWYCQSIDIPVTVVENDTIKGDVNADGNFTVADLVMLQKWLLAVPDVTLPNWKAADLCEDGTLNVFDLCMMKRELISQMQFDDTPVLFIDDYMISESPNGWKGEAYERVVTAGGSRYSRPLCDCAFLSWEDHINHIKSEGEKEEYIDLIKDYDVLEMISDFSKNASKYKNCKMKSMGFSVADLGEMKLSVLYKDENGNMQSLELYRFGGECAWLDNAEVQEFVKMLIERKYIPDKFILDIMNPDTISRLTMDDVLPSDIIDHGKVKP